MFVLVPFALCRTTIASFGTDGAELGVQVRIATHESRAEGAQIGTVAAGFDALRHHLHHVTTETLAQTIFTVLKALEASFDTGRQLRVARLNCSHQISPQDIARSMDFYTL
jgi:hypothetical protein